MGRLAAAFNTVRAAERAALIPYVTAGYPTMEGTPALLDALVKAGADVIELGIPFSDPVADGPTIQRSSQRALDNGVTLDWTFDCLRAFRARHDTPVVLFTYLNPVLRRGVDAFLSAALEAGADGVLVTDLPVGSDAKLESAFESSPLPLIRLIAPTTTPPRARAIAARAQGFIYYIARKGVTGATAELRSELAGEVEALRAVADVPVAVGFGISTPEQARSVAAVADGVVVGSALIDALDGGGTEAAVALIRDLRAAMSAR